MSTCLLSLEVRWRGWRPGLHLPHSPGLPDLCHLGAVLLVLGVVMATPHHSRHVHKSPREAVITQVTASVRYLTGLCGLMVHLISFIYLALCCCL